MSEREISEEEAREMSKKQFRKEFPSGWMQLTRYETLVLVIDAMLESSPGREFTPSELSDEAGASTKSVKSHLDKLVELGIVQELEDRKPPRYSINEKSPITQKLYELNLTVQRVKEGELEKSLETSPRRKILTDHGNRWDDGVTKKIKPTSGTQRIAIGQ